MDCYNNLMRFQRVNLLVSKAEVVRRLFTKKKNRECEENVCTATVPQEDDQQENNN